jgi:2,3-bisphosphoglycerate-independent phosphoglycerate mutase
LVKKIQAIEAFDAQVVGPVVEGARGLPNVRLLVVTDHLTPISKRTHVNDPVPYVLIRDLHADLRARPNSVAAFCERTAQRSNRPLVDGVALFEAFVSAS